MPELEFTGERVIPGLVDENLFNEHVARYRFAARFVRGRDVLDAGCGSGYGAAEFRAARNVTAIDIAAEALRHARTMFGTPADEGNSRFVQARCEAMPFAGASFDVVAAFEVIEHLKDWAALLAESRRVLRPEGLLIVSTPNKAYYSESRKEAGPNPFHVHEFEAAEFEAALRNAFPHVKLWAQNHSEAIVFLSGSREGWLDARGEPVFEQAHFFLAVCSGSPILDPGSFALVPNAANLLRERERHIALLDGEVVRKTQWLGELETSHAKLQSAHEGALVELERANDWGRDLDAELKRAGDSVARLQAELDAVQVGYRSKVRELETESAGRLEWGQNLQAQIERAAEHAAHLERDLAQHAAELAVRLEQLRRVRDSKWLRLGRKLKLGPAISAD